MLIDTHAHLDTKEFEGRIEEILERSKKMDVLKVVTVGASVEESRKALEISQNYKMVWAAAGIHPEESCRIKKEKKNLDELVFEAIAEIARKKTVVAVGEIGLDYHYEKIDQDIQKELFRKQIELAEKLKKPIIVHLRDCGEDADEWLRKVSVGFVLHSFTGDWKRAQKILSWGGILGFGGIATYKDEKLEKVVKKIDSDKYVLETDCPFLSPEPLRGKVNEPKNIYYIAQCIAKLRGESLEKVSNDSSKTACDFFGI
jgi:TatD DNase family protein